METKNDTLSIKNVIKKYENEITVLTNKINESQKQINKDRETVTYLTNKIQTLKDIALDLKEVEEEETVKKFKDLNNLFEQAKQPKPTDLLDKAAQAAKKWSGLDTKNPSLTSTKTPSLTSDSCDYWNTGKTWSECSKELNKLIEELNKNKNATHLDIYTTAIWPADLGM